jgi:hypothetical protein
MALAAVMAITKWSISSVGLRLLRTFLNRHGSVFWSVSPQKYWKYGFSTQRSHRASSERS